MYKKHFQGNIYFKSSEIKALKSFMDYEAPYVDADLCQTLMTRFRGLNFTADEKSKLSVAHRRLLTQFKEINVFTLKIHMKHFIQHIEKTAVKNFEIHADGYGAFIALAAIYSGELPKNKSITFYFSDMPIALFPEKIAKSKTIPKNCSVHFGVQQNSWIEPFSTLMNHSELKVKFLKAS